MIRQQLYIRQADWIVVVYYAIDGYNIERIIADMKSMGCKQVELRKAIKMMEKQFEDEGFTCSNLERRKSVCVIGLTSSPEEFQNTYDHEKGHIMRHISQGIGLNPYSEKEQYILGELSQQMFKVGKRFLCDHCRCSLRKFKNIFLY